jgi:hypothetical protein
MHPGFAPSTAYMIFSGNESVYILHGFALQAVAEAAQNQYSRSKRKHILDFPAP